MPSSLAEFVGTIVVAPDEDGDYAGPFAGVLSACSRHTGEHAAPRPLQSLDEVWIRPDPERGVLPPAPIATRRLSLLPQPLSALPGVFSFPGERASPARFAGSGPPFTGAFLPDVAAGVSSGMGSFGSILAGASDPSDDPMLLFGSHSNVASDPCPPFQRSLPP